MATQRDDADPGVLREALRTIRALKARVSALESPAPIPIAIVGMSARFPGAATLDAFRQLLLSGGDAIGEPTRERLALWERSRTGGTLETGLPIKGGYIEWPLDRFDNEYFRISMRELRSMDPQQRLLLELSVEALEHAGIPSQSLRGSLTGVYYGLNNDDFSEIGYKSGNRAKVDTYAYTGNAFSVAAGRVSYALDLRGPNVALDTACSSSLVAIQFACRALAAGECNTALAGGASLIVSDAPTTALHRLNALSPDGHCWTFDARANGYARAEGGGVIVLKRLDDALAAGDRVHAVLLGGAVNHGGAASGLTAPNGAAQAALLRAALRSASLSPAQVDYIEAHGTGTPLGDPIEVGAISEVYAGERPQPLLLTSVKANVGHLEAAAGICGLIKMVQALAHDEIPPQANLGALNPALDLASIPAEIPRQRRAWPRKANGRRIGGISSFGISGTNAHVIVAEPPPLPPLAQASDPTRAGVRPEPVLLLSAITAEALRDVAKNAVEFLSSPALAETDYDVAYTSCARRDHHGHRLAIFGRGRSEWSAALRRFLDGDTTGIVGGNVSSGTHRTAFVFGDLSTSGAERLSRFIETSTDASALWEEARKLAHAQLGLVIPNAAGAHDEASAIRLLLLHFTVAVSLFRLWDRSGLLPDVVVGSGAGEIAAAHAAGAITLEDALRLLAGRARAVGVPGFAVERTSDPSRLVAQELAALSKGTQGRLAIVTPSGKGWALDDAVARLLAPTTGNDVVKMLRERGYGTIVDVSLLPNGVLGASVLPTVDANGDVCVLRSLVSAHCAGAQAVWSRYYSERGRVVALPTYPWQRVRIDMISGRMESTPSARGAEIVLLSAETPRSLAESAQRLREHLESHPEVTLGDIAYTLATSRAGAPRRLSITARSREELLEELRRAGALPAGDVHDDAEPGKMAWLFTGQGAQVAEMGRELYDEWPVFREALDAVWAALDAHLPKKLRDVMWANPGTPEASLLDETVYTQPALFAFEVALAALWRSWGVRPDYVTGHSIGELAAAHVAGVFSLEDAARLVVARGRLMQELRAGGAMVAIAGSEAAVAKAIAAHGAKVSIAAVNGPSSLVVSGDESAVLQVAADFANQGVRTKRLAVSHAFHSSHMDPMLAEFQKIAGSVEYRQPSIPVVSNVTGRLASHELTVPAYWVKHVRDAVRFGSGIATLHGEGVRTFVEVGPQATLVGLVPACLPEADQERARLVTSRSKDGSERVAILQAAGALYRQGATLDVAGLFPWGGRAVALPSDRLQMAGEATGHPLLRTRLPLAGDTAVYDLVIDRESAPWVFDHLLVDKVVVPGAAQAELLRAAAENFFGTDAIEVAGLAFRVPLLVPDHGGQHVQVVLQPDGDGAQVSVYSRAIGAKADEKWTLHGTGTVRTITAGALPAVDWAAVRERCTEVLDPDQVYRETAEAGLDLQAAFRGMRRLIRGDEELYSEIELPAHVELADRYGIHPALLDAAVQSMFPIRRKEGALFLPFAIERFVLHRSGVSAGKCHVRLTSKTDGMTAFGLDLTIADDEDRVIAEIEGLQVRAIDVGAFVREQATKQAKENTSDLYMLDWPVIAQRPTATTLGGRWLIVASSDDAVADSLVASLGSAGVEHRRVEPERLASGLPADHVVCIWSHAKGEPGEAVRLASEALSIAQALAKESSPSRLWWVTAGGVAATSSDQVSPALASIWGLGRTLMQEHPELGCTLVDVEPQNVAWKAVLAEAGAEESEREIAWRSGERRAPRLMRAPAAQLPSGENYALEITQKGVLENLRLVDASRRAPGPGEIEIAIRATGLNFRDVLTSLGRYPGEGGPLGIECSGVVVAVGPGVERLTIGDRVMAIGSGMYRRFVTVDARRTARIPAGWTFEEAAGVPGVFLTAWYALRHLANLKRGERILVHAAAGGVGMAAVQVAGWLGAQVFGTASPSKWEVVRGLGVEHVASSRDLSFYDEFRAATGSDGVDVVLNSLTGDFIDRSVALLRNGGRFVEIGKSDLRDGTAFPGVSYSAFDILEVPLDRIEMMFRELGEAFESGALRPIRVRAFPITEVESAFRFMAQARHVGKLVLVPPRALRTDGTVLITGGLGELGLLVARSLAKRGVKHLVLTGRRGLATAGAAEAIRELEGLGVNVTVAAVDVADRDALGRVVSAIGSDRPLRGVVHAAGVVDDGMIAGQTAERLMSVMAGKVAGAANLDVLTRGVDLDIFVLFSSATGTFGNAGQGSYGAANAFLDGLAAHRKLEGLAGQSLAWGLWTSDSDRAAGLASKLNDAQRARLVGNGFGALTPSEGIALFEAALARMEAQLVPLAIDLKALGSRFNGDVPPVWRSLVKGGQRVAKAPTKSGVWSRELGALSAERRAEAVLDAVRDEVARILSLPSGNAVPTDRPLKELGLDSLTAVEVRNALCKRVGATLPATLAFDFPTAGAMAKFLLEKLFSNAPVAASAPVARSAARSANDPIAIIGIGCRIPGGVNDLASFWRLLDGGIDAVTEVPPERWDVDAWYDPSPDAQGKLITRWGSFLDFRELEQFDAAFFGISPTEAVTIDPQQRLLLETTWEALESAGIPADGLMGSDAGVYMGLTHSEYQARAMQDAKSIDAYSFLGTAHSAMAGRISYWLGLKGPNMPVDTACSSSLVALHLACQALRNGEVNMAFAGGANTILDPRSTVYFSRLGAMSPTGRCHTFSADADGYVRAEAAGVVILERLSDARKNGHRVLALVRGTAVNQDGRSNGLTAPNGPSQEAVIREALERSRVEPASIGYLECHGTGTPLGDTIEVQAAAAVLGEGRSPDRPLVLSSAKSNIGHAEAAAGIAGVIKAVLSIQHGRIPKTLHVGATLNRQIPWSDLPVTVAVEGMEWPRSDTPRRAGVSSFGFSGTNAHVVLEEAPKEEKTERSAADRSAEMVVLSAKSAKALDDAAERLQAHLASHLELSLGDVAYGLATTRTHHAYRAAFIVKSREELARALKTVSSGTSPVGGVRDQVEEGKLAFLFTGQGAQTLGMGRALYAEWPVFHDALDAVCAALDPHLPRNLREVMWASSDSADAALLHQTQYAQPALFAVEVALAALWRSWGVRPHFVMGHSIGEVAAAHVAGVLTLEDAVRLIAARGRLMQALPAGGAMVAIGASEAVVAEALKDLAGSVSIAAINAPDSVVISGAADAVLPVAEAFAKEGTRTKQLEVSHAFHSPLMEPMLEAFRKVAESIQYRAAEIPIISNVTGALATDEPTRAEYWVAHVRRAVRFGDGVEALHRAGVTRFIEVGPRATLLGLVPSSLSDAEQERVRLVASLVKDKSELVAILEALGSLYANGVALDFKGIFPAGGRRVELPTYAWQRKRFWVEPAEAQNRRGKPTGHPLLKTRLPVAGQPATDAAASRFSLCAIYEASLSRSEHPWLSERRGRGKVNVSAAAIIELVHAAGEQLFDTLEFDVSDVRFATPLFLPERGNQRVQIVVDRDGEGARASVLSQAEREDSDDEWTLHATAQLVHRANNVELPALDWDALGKRCTEIVDVARLFDAGGIELGSVVNGLRNLTRGDGEVVGVLELPSSVDGASALGIHPTILDAALQAAEALLEKGAGITVPASVRRISILRVGVVAAKVHARRTPEGVDLTLADEDGEVIAEVSALRAQTIDAAFFAREPAKDVSRNLYRVDWPTVASSERHAPFAGRWVVVASNGDPGAEALSTRLVGAGASCTRVEPARYEEALPADHVVWLWGPSADDFSEEARRFTSEGLRLVQRLAKEAKPPRLWWVTTGAAATSADDRVVPSLASVRGLGRAVIQEQPEIDCTLVDVPFGMEGIDLLFRELGIQDDEREIAWRRGERRVARVVRCNKAANGPAPVFRTNGTVVVTGGLGSVGVLVARWLAEKGYKHLVLTGRRGMNTHGAPAVVAELEALGARVTVSNADASDRHALARTLASIPPDLPLRGVVHMAAVFDAAMLAEQTPERFARLMAPKVGGACHLDALTRNADLDFFVMFSSIAGTFGIAAMGSGAYGPANAFLDALAWRRRAEGLPAHSLAWGMWADPSGRLAAQERILSEGGLGRALSSKQGIALLEAALGSREAHLLPVEIDLRTARRRFEEVHVVPPLWRNLVSVSSAKVRDKAGAWAREIARLDPASRTEVVLAVVRADVARLLSIPDPADVAPDRSLKELGLDSLMAVDLRNTLARRAGTRLPATLVFDYPSSLAIASYLLEKVFGYGAAPPPSTSIESEIVPSVGLTIEQATQLSDQEAVARLNQELSGILDGI